MPFCSDEDKSSWESLGNLLWGEGCTEDASRPGLDALLGNQKVFPEFSEGLSHQALPTSSVSEL